MNTQINDRVSDGFVRSFTRGLKVIEAMGRGSETHTVATISTATDLPRTVVRRILMTLVELGYSWSDGKSYRLTPKVLTLGMTYLTSLPFWGLAQHVLEQLSAQVKESVALSVFDGHSSVYVLRIPSREIMSLQLGVGSRVPAYATSPGRVLLAWQPEDALQQYLSSTDLRQLTRKTLTDKTKLLATIVQVRETEYSWVDGEFDTSICGLSVPVRDATGHPVAALSVNLLSGTTTENAALRELLRPMRAAAEQLRGMTPQFLSTAKQTARAVAI